MNYPALAFWASVKDESPIFELYTCVPDSYADSIRLAGFVYGEGAAHARLLFISPQPFL